MSKEVDGSPVDFPPKAKLSVDADDVCWFYTRHEPKDGKAPSEWVFETEQALAVLLINEVIFLNNYWWEKDWPKRARKAISLNVNCNDVFAWGCADAETLPYDQIETLYRMWAKDPVWGPAVWCMIQRKEMPQTPVEREIRRAAIWDLGSLGLDKNTTDEAVSAYVQAVLAQPKA